LLVGFSEAFDETARYRVSHFNEHDRDRICQAFESPRIIGADRYDEVGGGSHDLPRNGVHSAVVDLDAIADLDLVVLGPPEPCEFSAEHVCIFVCGLVPTQAIRLPGSRCCPRAPQAAKPQPHRREA
jgi:hypothetical protein